MSRVNKKYYDDALKYARSRSKLKWQKLLKKHGLKKAQEIVKNANRLRFIPKSKGGLYGGGSVPAGSKKRSKYTKADERSDAMKYARSRSKLKWQKLLKKHGLVKAQRIVKASKKFK